MNPSIYVSISTEPGVPSAERTSIRYDQFVAKLLKPLPEAMNACHIAMGLAGELGELFEDDANFKEEYGDYEFYLQAALLHYGLTHKECMPSQFCVSAHDFIFWTGQLVDCIKREYIYNKPRELDRIKEVIGNLCRHLADSYTDTATTRQDILQQNATKLQARYASMYYTDEQANARADKTEKE